MCRADGVCGEKDIDGMPEMPATPPGHDVPCISSDHCSITATHPKPEPQPPPTPPHPMLLIWIQASKQKWHAEN